MRHGFMKASSAALAVVCGLWVSQGLAAQQARQSQPTTTTSTAARAFEIVSVEGNKLVVRGPEGTREITVPPDFRFTVNGKPVAVSDLRAGMKGTATITTTTTTTPVYVTEVKNGEVMRVAGTSVIVRGPNGIQQFSEGDVARRGVSIYRDGKRVSIGQLIEGDRLTATIVTEGPPRTMTEQQVTAVLSAPAARAATAATAAGNAARDAATATANATTAAAAAATGAAKSAAETAADATARAATAASDAASAAGTAAKETAAAASTAAQNAAQTAPQLVEQSNRSLLWIAGAVVVAILLFLMLRSSRTRT